MLAASAGGDTAPPELPLKRAGVQDVYAREECIDRRDGLANLQLLQGDASQSKSDQPVADWFKLQYGEEVARGQPYRARHYFPEGSLELGDFLAFTDARHEFLKDALPRMLVTAGQGAA